MSAVDQYNPWPIAHAVNKGAWRIGQKSYRTAQNLGMRYQNWRHKGAGGLTAENPATAAMPGPNSLSPRGKNWTSDEESFTNTSYTKTTYTRKRTR